MRHYNGEKDSKYWWWSRERGRFSEFVDTRTERVLKFILESMKNPLPYAVVPTKRAPPYFDLKDIR